MLINTLKYSWNEFDFHVLKCFKCIFLKKIVWNFFYTINLKLIITVTFKLVKISPQINYFLLSYLNKVLIKTVKLF